MEYVQLIGYYLFVFPLREIYFKGPRLWGWGGWEGFASEDICAHLTQVTSSVWKSQHDHCTDLLERKFQAFLVSVFGISYFFLAYKLLSYLWFRYFILAPILKELQQTYHSCKYDEDKKTIK